MDFRDLSEPVDGFAADDYYRRHQSSDPGTAKDLIISVYRQVWKEFYEWEPDECKQVIGLLASKGSSLLDASIRSNYTVTEADNSEIQANEGETLSLWSFDGDSTKLTQLSCEELLVSDYPSYPVYEACAPLSRNISWRPGEEDESSLLLFVPYADEPQFNAIGYAKRYEHFAWIRDQGKDPDIEMIQLEAVRRLHFGYGMSLSDIDQHEILPASRFNNESGLLWETSQRDPLFWTGSSLSALQLLSSRFECPEDDLITRVNQTLTIFCPNLNCLQPFCPTHVHPYPCLDPVKPRVNSTGMILSERDACGDECFRLAPDNYTDLVLWNDSDIRTLEGILKIAPDLFPCELSHICRKPCREVFAQRCRIIPDEYIVDPDEELIPTKKAPPPIFNDEEYEKFTPLHPCHHEGPCDQRAGCQCFIQSLHCSRNCRCGFDCQLRWKGCRCKMSKTACTTADCPCVRQQRECDPDLCTRCDAKKGASVVLGLSKKSCKNIVIQAGLPAPVEVKRGIHGLGLFAQATIKRGQFIGEYVGDILWRNYNLHRYALQKYRGLNYFFDLNEGFIIDSARAGGPTMYMNHASDGDDNVDARIRYVNAEHRIGFFATKKIARGKELLFDYGPEYWKNQDAAIMDSDSE